MLLLLHITYTGNTVAIWMHTMGHKNVRVYFFLLYSTVALVPPNKSAYLYNGYLAWYNVLITSHVCSSVKSQFPKVRKQKTSLDKVVVGVGGVCEVKWRVLRARILPVIIIHTVRVRDGRSERRDDEVSFESNHLFVIINPLTVISLLCSVELHSSNVTVLCDYLGRTHEWQKFTFLLFSQLHLLVIRQQSR